MTGEVGVFGRAGVVAPHKHAGYPNLPVGATLAVARFLPLSRLRRQLPSRGAFLNLPLGGKVPSECEADEGAIADEGSCCSAG